MPTTNEPQVKGMAVINARNWLDERLGDGWFTKTARTIEPSFPDRVLPGDWYSVRTFDQVYRAAYTAIDGFESRQHLMERVTVEVALNDLNGILRAFLWVASPKMFLRTTPKIWDTYCNFTQMELLHNEPGSFRARISEIPTDLAEWVSAAWVGFLPPALELTGAKNCVASIVDRHQTQGADTWEFNYELTYSSG